MRSVDQALPAKLSGLTEPLGLHTCRVIMRTSQEPSQEIVFSLKSPEQSFPFIHVSLFPLKIKLTHY